MSYVVLQVGQCGNQLGNSLFGTLSEIFDSQGEKNAPYLDDAADRFFTVSEKGRKRIARAVLIDTEPKVIKEILKPPKKSSWCYNSNGYKIQQQGAGNNWAMGYYEHGAAFKQTCLDLIRKEVEKCDSLHGFLLLMSVAGGTGSGVSAFLSEVLRDEFSSTSSANIAVWPFKKGEVSVQAYNAMLSLAHIQSSSDAIFTFENDQLLRLCQQRMGLHQVSLHHMNAVASEQLANLLLPARTSSTMNPIFSDLLAHLVPHPQFKLVSLRSVPQESQSVLPFSAHTWPGLLRTLRRMLLYNSIVDEAYGRDASQVMATKCPPVSLANLLVLRGKDSALADSTLLHQPSLCYASWVEPGSRLQTWHYPVSYLRYDRTAVLANNSRLSVACIDEAVAKAWKMYGCKAYFHHYSQYGLTEDDFMDCVLRVEQIVASYKSLSV